MKNGNFLVKKVGNNTLFLHYLIVYQFSRVFQSELQSFGTLSIFINNQLFSSDTSHCMHSCSSGFMPACCPGLYCLLWLHLPTELDRPLGACYTSRTMGCLSVMPTESTGWIRQKEEKSSFLSPSGDCWSRTILGSLFKHLRKLMILLKFIRTELVAAARHSASSVNSDF